MCRVQSIDPLLRCCDVEMTMLRWLCCDDYVAMTMLWGLAQSLLLVVSSLVFCVLCPPLSTSVLSSVPVSRPPPHPPPGCPPPRCSPCRLVWVHDAGDDDMIWEILLQFSHSLAPVFSSFLRDELNIEKGALARSLDMPWSGSLHNSRRHICHNILWNIFHAHTLSL